jgi:ribosomal protein L37AE/L43A
MQHEAAQPKGNRAPGDQPTSQPMHATTQGEVRRNPSSDQLRQRRQNQRQRKVAETEMTPGHVSCESCGHVGHPVLGDGTASNCANCGSYSVSNPVVVGGEGFHTWDSAPAKAKPLAVSGNYVDRDGNTVWGVDGDANGDNSKLPTKFELSNAQSQKRSDDFRQKHLEEARQENENMRLRQQQQYYEPAHEERPFDQQRYDRQQASYEHFKQFNETKQQNKRNKEIAKQRALEATPQEQTPKDDGRLQRWWNSGKSPKTATILNTDAWRLNPGDNITMPNGRTMKVQRVRPHETNNHMVYVDTDGGTTLAERAQRFQVRPHNSQQQSSPGYGTPGGNTDKIHGEEDVKGNNEMPHSPSKESNQCPSCRSKGTLQRQGDHYTCSKCGYRESFGGAGGHAFTDSPRQVIPRGQELHNRREAQYSTINTSGISAIARRARALLAQEENS